MRGISVIKQSALGFLAVGVTLALQPSAALAQDAASILNSRCSACHERTADGGLARISEIRKTPEGWDMNIARMMIVHGVEVTKAERAALVKHLADTQGLAPAETKDYRYILERQPGHVETPPTEDLGAVCGRCHSFARVALQRRNESEWRKNSHFHLGQFPTAEFQALGRDRDWFDAAINKAPVELAKRYGLKSKAWNSWSKAKKKSLAGEWRVAGTQPGRGSYQGTMKVGGDGGSLSVSMSLTFADGKTATGQGKALVYTGYEWRGAVKLGDSDTRQVLAASEDGNSMSGRWFLAGNDVIGGSLHAVRAGSGGAILSVEPAYIRAGEEAEVAIHGSGLTGSVSLGAGIEVTKLVSAGSDTTKVMARAKKGAKVGARNVSVGKAKHAGGLVVYKQVDTVQVQPPVTIARVGGAGGPIAPVPAQFEAVAFANGADGKAGTKDDVRIGVMNAAWTVDNFDELAAALKDKDFTGQIDQTGLFSPAGAGPNPDRKMSTNNAGNLAVIAKVKDQGRTVEGRGQLFVTVQRFVDPPIR